MCVNTHDLVPALGTTHPLYIAVLKETNVQVAFQVLYAYTSVSDAPNARANQARPDEMGWKPGIFLRGPSSPEGGPNVYAKKRILINHLITGIKEVIIKRRYDG